MNDYLQLREDFSQKCTTSNVDLSYLVYLRENNMINTDMDIQRNYVWNEDREQEMWDSLILNVRIPEFHALIKGNIWEVCDGKQRLTCIFKILNNEIAYKKSKAREECKILFNNKRQLYFKDLPQDLQQEIKNTTVTFAKYGDLSKEELIMLFKKINNGMPLSAFAKGMSINYFMKVDYSDLIFKMDQFKNFKNESQESVEKFIVRILLLFHNGPEIYLKPIEMDRYYSAFSDLSILVKNRENVIETIKRIPNLSDILKCRSWESIAPFLVYGVYKNKNLNSEQIKKLVLESTEFAAGRASDLTSSRCKANMQWIDNKIKKLLEEK